MTREDAIEIIRKNMPSDKSLPVYEALQTLVPELVESEDEKIREEMIRYFTEMKKGGSASLPYDACIAYLEKQKEQKSTEWSEEDENARQNLIAHFEGKVLRLSDEAKKEAVDWLKSLRPVKQEWSEDERKILDSIIDDYEKAERSFCGYAGKIGFLRAIRDGEYGLSKQKWSEEDEK